MPFVRFLFAVFMGEYHGRHRERFAFQPDYVFVVIDLIDRLVSRQVESKELLFAVDFGFAHRGEPVVVREEGIISFVVVDTDRALVGFIGFSV